ncbi:ribosome modulation factor [Jiangella muralis]|uniref:ribosome modulation factor n=1 Tax=Jiangella muralis TaxID=702383 RepID=UPI00069F1AE9|nr:Rmf/CrpP family protein [Jiangella muralis]
MTSTAVEAGQYGPRGLALRAARSGYDVGVMGGPVTDCPYERDRPVALYAWLDGYTRGRRAAGLPIATDVAE